MNAVDAGATRIDVRTVQDNWFQVKQLIIQDDGRGMSSREEIATHFQRLGFDHRSEAEKALGHPHNRYSKQVTVTVPPPVQPDFSAEEHATILAVHVPLVRRPQGPRRRLGVDPPCRLFQPTPLPKQKRRLARIGKCTNSFWRP